MKKTESFVMRLLSIIYDLMKLAPFFAFLFIVIQRYREYKENSTEISEYVGYVLRGIFACCLYAYNYYLFSHSRQASELYNGIFIIDVFVAVFCILKGLFWIAISLGVTVVIMDREMLDTRAWFLLILTIPVPLFHVIEAIL